MKKLNMGSAIFMIAMMLCGSAWALNATDHVKIAPNAKGDMLIFPWYLTLAGDSPMVTKISVINTSATDCVVAKVVYRSFMWSQEVLDHLIYLSPNDVWTGTIVMTSATGAGLYSDDDSIMTSTTSFATPANPVNVPFIATACSGDGNNNGYIEVIEAASVDYRTITNPDRYPVPKTYIYEWYNSITSTEIRSTYRPINVLNGYQENINAVSRSVRQAVVFADYLNFNKLTINEETFLGEPGVNNNLSEVEAALAKASVGLPYYATEDGDWSMHTFNYPTKIADIYRSGCNYRDNTESPYWNALGCVTYTRGMYDLSENSPPPGAGGSVFSPPEAPEQQPQMCDEVTRIYTQYDELLASFTEGWVRYIWVDHDSTVKTGTTESGAAITFTGSPVIPSVMHINSNGTWSESGASFTDGTVTVGGAAQPYYQYSE